MHNQIPLSTIDEEFSKKSFSVYPNKMINNNPSLFNLKFEVRYLWRSNLDLAHEYGKDFEIPNYHFDENGKKYVIWLIYGFS